MSWKPLPEFEAWNVTETAGSSISGEDSKGGRNLGAGQAKQSSSEFKEGQGNRLFKT